MDVTLPRNPGTQLEQALSNCFSEKGLQKHGFCVSSHGGEKDCLEEVESFLSLFFNRCMQTPSNQVGIWGGLDPCPRFVLNLLLYLEKEGKKVLPGVCPRSWGELHKNNSNNKKTKTKQNKNRCREALLCPVPLFCHTVPFTPFFLQHQPRWLKPSALLTGFWGRQGPSIASNIQGLGPYRTLGWTLPF